MFRLFVVLFMCALLPRWALAQDTASPPPTDDSLVAPPLVDAPEQVEPESFIPEPLEPESMRAEEGVSTLPRIVLETLSGGAGMVAGGLGGLVLGIGMTDCSIFESDCTAAAVFGLSGMAIGSALATWGAGSLMKGRGGFLSSLLGALLGTGAGLIMVSVDDDALGPLGLISMPVVGAVAGYELSRLPNVGPSSHFSLTEDRVPVIPAFGTTPRGGFMGGVAGRF